MKEWFEGRVVEDRKMLTLKVLKWLILAGVVLLAFAAVKEGRAEPLVQASSGNVTITVYSEDCAFKDTVINLPKRATWKEGDKVFEGCVGAIPQLGMAMFYFSDKTIAVVPMEMFKRLTGV